MKLSVLASLFFMIAVLVVHTNLMGQTNHADSALYQSSVYNAITFYRQSIQEQPRYFNGRKYKAYRIGFLTGTPFFESDQFVDGDFVYEGAYYEKAKLLYDQVTDMLIIKTGYAIELISERVEQFSLSGHTFTRMVKDSINKLPGTGFYEKLYAGKIEILKKEKKAIKEDLSDTEGVRGEISSKKYYWIIKGGKYYPVKNKSNVFEILSDRKNEIQQFIKYYDLNFKKDTDNTITKIAGYYDQLTR